MADQFIGDLTPMTTLTGSEIIPGDQSNITKSLTPDLLKTFMENYFAPRGGTSLVSSHTVNIAEGAQIQATLSPTLVRYLREGVLKSINSGTYNLADRPTTPDYSRFDAIYITAFDTIAVRTGTADTTPTTPTLSTGEILIAYVNIPNSGDIVADITQKTVYLSQGGNDENDGLSIESAVLTMDAAFAIMVAKSIPTLQCFDNGTYTLTGVFPTFLGKVTNINMPFASIRKTTDLSLNNNLSINCYAILANVVASSKVLGTILLNAFNITSLSLVNSRVNVGGITKNINSLTVDATSYLYCDSIIKANVLSITEGAKIFGIINEIEYTKGNNLTFVDFDVTPNLTGLTTTPGRVIYNAAKKCLEMQTEVAGVTMQIGQEMPFYLKCNEVGGIEPGKLCYIESANSGVVNVKKYIADGSISGEPVLLMYTGTSTLIHNDSSYFTLIGEINDLNSNALTEGQPAYASDTVAGDLTDTAPTGANSKVVNVGTVTYKHITQGIIFFHPQYIQLPKVLNLEQKTYHGFKTLPASPSITANVYTLPGSTPYDIYIGGVKHTISTNKTVTLPTAQGVGSQVFIYMNANLTLGTSITAWDILDTTVIPVDTAYYNASNDWIIGNENHNYGRNLLEHNNQHFSWGAQYVSGFVGLSVGSGAANTFTLPAGVIRDEELWHSIAEATTGRLGYRVSTNSNKLVFDAAGTNYAKLNGAIPRYDNNGVLTDLSANQYGVTWVYGTNRRVDKIAMILGQGQYASLADAQAAALPTLTGLSVAEWKLLYRIIYRRVSSALVFIQADALYLTNTGLAVNAGAAGIVPDNSITTNKLAPELKAKVAMSSTDIDWSAGVLFTLTLTGTTSLTFSNLKVSKIITLVVSGNYSFSISTSGVTLDKTSTGDYSGTATRNYIDFECIDDTVGAAIVRYAITQKL